MFDIFRTGFSWYLPRVDVSKKNMHRVLNEGFFLGKIGAEMFDIFRTVFPDTYREGEVLKKHAPSFERGFF